MDAHYSLPNSWVWTSLGEVIDTSRRRVNPKDYPGLQYVGLENIESNTMRLLGTTPASDMSSSVDRFYPGDVLYGRMRPYLNKVYLAEFEGVCSSEFIVFRQVKGIAPSYLAYILNSHAFVSFASHIAEGDRPRVGIEQLVEYPFPLAPIREQHRIVEEIESYFTRLDAAVASLRRAQTRLQTYKTSLLKAACEGRLVPTEAELAKAEGRDYEPASVLLERVLAERRAKWEAAEWERLVDRAKQQASEDAKNASGKQLVIDEDYFKSPDAYKRYLPQNDTWKNKYSEPNEPDTANLPKLPDGWVWATVEQLGNVHLGRQRSPQHHQGPYMRPYLRAANATWDGVDLSDVNEMNFPPDDFERYKLYEGDILIGEASGSMSEVGKSFIWRNEIPDCCFQNTLIRVQSYLLPPEYLHIHFLKDARTKQFGNVAKGIGIYHLGAKRLAAMAVALPPLSELQAIIKAYGSLSSIVSNVERAVEINIRRYERLRQSLLKRAFSGKLVAQDPEDESAQVMLERIQAERKNRQMVVKNSAKSSQSARIVREVSAREISKRKTVLKVTKESVREAIEQLPSESFSFADIQEKVPSNYETLKEIIFELLGEAKPTIHLVFDQESKAMRFTRGQR